MPVSTLKNFLSFHSFQINPSKCYRLKTRLDYFLSPQERPKEHLHLSDPLKHLHHLLFCLRSDQSLRIAPISVKKKNTNSQWQGATSCMPWQSGHITQLPEVELTSRLSLIPSPLGVSNSNLMENVSVLWIELRLFPLSAPLDCEIQQTFRRLTSSFCFSCNWVAPETLNTLIFLFPLS